MYASLRYGLTLHGIQDPLVLREPFPVGSEVLESTLPAKGRF